MAPVGFVYVIESPSTKDLLDGRTEGGALTQVLDLARIPRWYSLVTDRETLNVALGSRLWAAWQEHRVPPVLHLSMHGNQDGVALTTGVFLTWNELRHILVPLNRAMQGGLLICMSTCFGGSGCRMAMYTDNEPPFWALVGNSGSPSWPDAAVAYITFYHLFFKGFEVNSCVQAMVASSGDSNFMWYSGQRTRTQWEGFMQTRLQSFLGDLEQTTKQYGS